MPCRRFGANGDVLPDRERHGATSRCGDPGFCKPRVIGFADGKNDNLALEAGIYNLTQEEAPGLLHHGIESSEAVLLVRLKAPACKVNHVGYNPLLIFPQ